MTDTQILALVLAVGFWWIGRKITSFRDIVMLSSAELSNQLSNATKANTEQLSKDVHSLSFAVERVAERSGKRCTHL